jgi:Mg2+-importing ATPase
VAPVIAGVSSGASLEDAARAPIATLLESTDAVIILAIVAMSVGLGFVNEYRSLQVVAELDRRLRRTAIALRDGCPQVVDGTSRCSPRRCC